MGRCHACSSNLKLAEIQGSPSFLDEYGGLGVDAMLVSWEAPLFDGSDGCLLYRCPSCGVRYEVYHRWGRSVGALSYHNGTRDPPDEHWVLGHTYDERKE